MRARSATSRRIVHTYPTKTIALCIMHYACCDVSAVLFCPTVLFCAVQPVHLCVFVSKIRSENKFAILIDSGLNFLFFCEVARLGG